ncbi:hypothetical protein C2G38_2227351 [Gigaspora rosea]|uniref:Fungal lipase-type domain-containing protein n=1 Tax=Gigaspora rosea TaxID=44941 RepID=A0A397TX41_9GLOM|nr:hypothetical protein C2G38_2227351 [Gigaspora rosea]
MNEENIKIQEDDLIQQTNDVKVIETQDYEDPNQKLQDVKVRDLFRSKQSRIPKLIRGRIEYFIYIFRIIEYLNISLYLDWTVIVRHPLNFVIVIIFFTTSAVSLFLAGIIFMIWAAIKRLKCLKCLEWFIAEEIIIKRWTTEKEKWQRIDKLKASTFKFVKLLEFNKSEDKPIFEEDLIDGLECLGTENNSKRIQRINRLKALLFLSSLVYKRETKHISKMHDCIFELKRNYKKKNNNSFNGIYRKLQEINTYEKLQKIHDKLMEEHKKDIGEEYKTEIVEENIKDIMEEGDKNNGDDGDDSLNNIHLKLQEIRKIVDNHNDQNERNELMDDNFPNNIYKELKKILEVLKKIAEKHKKEDDENNLLNDIHNELQRIQTFKNIESKVFKIMVENDKFFDKQIEILKDNNQGFDLKFTSISELNTDDGATFCGMFWSKENNFIVVSFKGTTPTNFGEWLRNLTFQSVDARSFLFGQVHRGFYEYLFPKSELDNIDYPCKRIIEAVSCKAKELIRAKNLEEKHLKENEKVKLWITGHSLGGALATLFYARLLKIRLGDLKNTCSLKDAVTFAGPAVGDHHFAVELNSLQHDPLNNSNLLRVILQNDIVPKLPYRACETQMRKYGYNFNVLMNYCQVGNKYICEKYDDKDHIQSLHSVITNEDYCEWYSQHHKVTHKSNYKTFKRYRTLLPFLIIEKIFKTFFIPYYMMVGVVDHDVDSYISELNAVGLDVQSRPDAYPENYPENVLVKE